MNDDITQQPLARAVLSTLARTRDGNDALGSLARVVLTGQADLRTAASYSWHSGALDSALTESLARRQELSADEQAELERQVQRLRDADDEQLVEVDDGQGDEKPPAEDVGRR